ncbi:hypothetical protein CEXT_352921 [Caerostris extrusa]|uniref:Uncharacterized protein n=1 Tax=Caerostris extrusa TaxID=172846 RepID=A0AAV4WJ36_CAEEX|nr:hypothetical protein CEXT_352921 [Caerostris extrusa]
MYSRRVASTKLTSSYVFRVTFKFQKQHLSSQGKIKVITLPHPMNAINIARRERYLFFASWGETSFWNTSPQELGGSCYRLSPSKAKASIYHNAGKVSEYYECSNAGPLQISSKRLFADFALFGESHVQQVQQTWGIYYTYLKQRLPSDVLSLIFDYLYIILGENQRDHPHPVNAINIARRGRYSFLPPGVRHPFGISLHRNLETVDIDYRPQKAKAFIYHNAGKVSEYYECSNAGPLQISPKRLFADFALFCESHVQQVQQTWGIYYTYLKQRLPSDLQKAASVIAGENQSDHPPSPSECDKYRQEGAIFIFASWGETSFWNTSPQELEAVDIDYRPQKAKASIYQTPEKFPNITNAQMLVLFRYHPERHEKIVLQILDYTTGTAGVWRSTKLTTNNVFRMIFKA